MDAAKVVPCSECGKPIEALYSAAVRLFEREVCYFCCDEHALLFVPERAPKAAANWTSEPDREPEVRLEETRDNSAASTAGTHGFMPDLPEKRKDRAAADPSTRSSPFPSDRPPNASGPGGAPRARVLGAARPSPSAAVNPAFAKPPSSLRAGSDPESENEAGPSRDVLFPKPWGHIPVALLFVLTCISLIGGPITVTWPLTFLACLGLALWEQRAQDRAAELPRRYAAEVRVRLHERTRARHEATFEWIPAERLRVGQEFLVEPGEIVGADGLLINGSGSITLAEGAPWDVGQGHNVPAGSRLLTEEPLLIRAQRVGRDRALTRLFGLHESSFASAYWTVRFGRTLAFLVAPLLGVGALLMGRALGEDWLSAACLGATVWACLSSAAIAQGTFWLALDTLMRLESRGVTFPNAEVLAIASNVGTAVFCARGTVQQGRPQVVEIHALRESTERDVLGLALGALAGVHHPTAEAVARAAGELGVSPSACRGHSPAGGANMKCRGPSGLDVTVGGREFLLRQRVSIAWVEERLRSIESQAQTVLLVADNDELTGILALTDDLAEGARPTMQRLLASGIEPALLSGDSRETTEALARRLHIDHVRPEAKVAERRREVEKLRTAGLPVAVIGRLGSDDGSLLGADLPVLLGGARGYSPSFSSKDEARAASVWSGKLADAGDALIEAHALGRASTQLLLFRVAPTLLFVCAAALLVLPAFSVPLSAALAQVLAQRLKLPEGTRQSAP